VGELGPLPLCPPSPAPNATSGLPLNQVLDRLDRLEHCFADELQAVFGACRGLLADEAGDERRQAYDTEQIWEYLKRLAACVHEHEDKLSLCVFEASLVSFQERLDERFQKNIERMSEHRADVQKTVKAWRDNLEQRCTALERRISEQRSHQVLLAQQLEDQHDAGKEARIEQVLLDHSGALQALAEAAQRREAELLQQLEEREAGLAKQLEERGVDVAKQLEEQASAVEELLDRRMQAQFAQLKSDVGGLLEEHGAELKHSQREIVMPSSSTHTLVEELQEQLSQMHLQFADLRRDVSQREESNERKVQDMMKESAEETQQSLESWCTLKLQAHGDRMHTEMIREVEDLMAHSTQQLTLDVESCSQQLKESVRVKRWAESQTKALDERISKLAETTRARMDQIARDLQSASLKKEVEDLEGRLDSICADSQSGILDERISKVEETIGERMDQISRDLLGASSKKEVEDLRSRLDSMMAENQELGARLTARLEELESESLSLASATKNEVENRVEQLMADSGPIAQRLQEAVEEAKAAGENGRAAAVQAAEAAARDAAQHIKDFQEREAAISEACSQHTERLVSELRAEAAANLDAAKSVITDEHKRSLAVVKKDLSNVVDELRTADSSLTKQLERATEEARGAAERGRTAVHAAEEARAVSQSTESRVQHQEQRLNSVAEASHQQLERLSGEIRGEARGSTDALESRLGVQIKELQAELTALRKQTERTAGELRDTSASTVKQVQQFSEEARAVSDRCTAAAQVSQEVRSEVQICESRLHGLDNRLTLAVDDCRQQMDRQIRELRAEAASGTEAGRRQMEQLSEELRGMGSAMTKQASDLRTEAGINSDSAKNHAQHLVDQVRDGTANFARQLEHANEESRELRERSSNIARAAEEARTLAQRSEGRVSSLEGRVDALVDARCQQVERTCKEVSREARGHGDSVTKLHGHVMEELRELRATSGLLAKQVQQALQDARAAGDRGAAAAQVAQEAVATAQRAEGSTSRLNTSSVSAGMEVSRSHLDRTASDIRMEARNGIDRLGRELENTALELRGTINALALQVECGVSGSQSVLADAESEAQRHVDRLEWSRELDGHRGQMEKTQSELEERLSAMLQLQKDCAKTDIEGVKFVITKDLETGFKTTMTRLDGLNANLIGMDAHFKTRIVGLEHDFKSLNERMNELQTGISANQWRVATIAGAFSGIAQPNDH